MTCDPTWLMLLAAHCMKSSFLKKFSPLTYLPKWVRSLDHALAPHKPSQAKAVLNPAPARLFLARCGAGFPPPGQVNPCAHPRGDAGARPETTHPVAQPGKVPRPVPPWEPGATVPFPHHTYGMAPVGDRRRFHSQGPSPLAAAFFRAVTLQVARIDELAIIILVIRGRGYSSCSDTKLALAP